jgi:hypothetical protein
VSQHPANIGWKILRDFWATMSPFINISYTNFLALVSERIIGQDGPIHNLIADKGYSNVRAYSRRD